MNNKQRVAFGLILMLPLSLMADDQPASVNLETIDVIGVSPLQGGGLDINKIPTNVQTVSAQELQEAQSLSLADYMNRYMGSVHINEAQNNPLQPDVYYRGFVASPLLGLPQGLSVYVNGVRFNEPFGDSVNWDLIPEGAIDTMALYSGSNPVYGLNTLGGAISLKTKTGFTSPGHQLEVSGGSWDRHSEELTSGWNNGTFGYFLDVRNFGEQGWRDHSRTSARQILGTLSWQNDRAELDLTLAANDNDMKGNGAVPIQLFKQSSKSIFTYPDQTVTRMFFSELSGKFDLTDKIELSGNAFFRQNRIRTFNGDDSDFEECEDLVNDGFLCEEEGDDEERVEDVFGNDVLASDMVEGATNNTSQTHQRTAGGSVQAAFSQDLFEHENHFLVGASYEYADVHFESDTELAALNPDRGTTGSGIEIEDSKVRLNTASETYSVYFSDHFSVTDQLTISFAGRYNHTRLEMDNQYFEDVDKLTGEHTFDRFNPSTGFTFAFNEYLTVYGSYSESSRAPTAMELSCADPEDSCKLPNSFVADPPLDQVVSKTFEGGLRGTLGELIENGDVRWNLGVFQTTNHDDIIFRRAEGDDSLNEGYFSNVGQTRRYGIEAGLDANFTGLFSDIDDWHVAANYTYLNAQYRNSFSVQDPLDLEDGGPVVVEKGDRITGLPEHIFKGTVGVELWRKLSLNIDGLYSGAQYYRGDEANLTGKLGGYWLFNARAELKVTENVALFGKVDNIFDRKYKSFGVYGQADEVLGDSYNDGRFVSPGAPRAGWIGVRVSL